MASPPRTGVTRRHALTLAVGATVTRAARASIGPPPSQMPRTLADAVASMETLISPEAIDKISALSEARQFEYRWGFSGLRSARWGNGKYEWSYAVPSRLEAECRTAGFPPEDLTDYLISTIAWRRRGRPLDVAAQLKPFQEADQREAERDAKRRAEREAEYRRTGVRIWGGCPIGIPDLLFFERGTAKTSPGQETFLDGMARMIVGLGQILHLEVQAHAAPGEARPGDLSTERAVATVEALVRLGVPAEWLTAYGLGTRFPNLDLELYPKKNARDAQARAEFRILRRVKT